MAKSRVPSPQDVVKVRRLPAKGDRITITVQVTRVGPNRTGTGEAVTFRVPGSDTPITVDAMFLDEDN